MSLFVILIALVLAFLAFKFVKGMVKFGLLAVIILVGLFIAHQSGAF